MSTKVTFLHATRPDRKLVPHEGAGHIEFDGNQLVLCGSREHPGLSWIAGTIGFVPGLALGIAGIILADNYGLDLFRYRKGPVLGGMICLLLGMGGAGVANRIASLVFGRSKLRRVVDGPSIEGVGEKDGKVAVHWTAQGVKWWVVFRVEEGTAIDVDAKIRSIA